MKLAMAQVSMSADIDENYHKTLKYIDAARDCDLLFFPEIQLTPFSPQYLPDELKSVLDKSRDDFALSMDDFRIKALAEKCRWHRLRARNLHAMLSPCC